MSAAAYAVGLDLGGTNIKALAVTPAGQVLAEVVRPTEDKGDGAWQQNVAHVFDLVCAKAGDTPSWTGVAAPGIAGKDERSIAFMPCRLSGLQGLVWRDFLKTPGAVPVVNDAHSALLGEIWLGAARDARNAMLLTLGTGVGGAAVVDGVLLRGHLGRAGHLGHISLNPSGPLDLVNTPGSLEDAIGECTLRKRSGGRFETTEALVRAAKASDAEASRIWLASVQALGAGIASLINVLDPEVVVLGGGIAQSGEMLFSPLSGFLEQYEWRPGEHAVRVVPAMLGDRAGAFGAAWNAMRIISQPIK
jgi:glucokinase